jgi:hypothetical protein
MADWGGRGNSQDLIDRHEGWGEFTRSILFQYPATGFVVETIEEATPATNDPADASVGPTLPELVQALYEKRPAYTVELFIRQESGARERILDQDETLSTAALASTDVYQSTTVYQYKMMLRHAGVLHPDVAAKSTDELNPSSNHWTLRTSIGI